MPGKEALDGFEGDKHSPYAKAIIDLLDRDQDISLTFRAVRAEVEKVTKGFQIPMVEEHLSGGAYYLTR